VLLLVRASRGSRSIDSAIRAAAECPNGTNRAATSGPDQSCGRPTKWVSRRSAQLTSSSPKAGRDGGNHECCAFPREACTTGSAPRSRVSSPRLDPRDSRRARSTRTFHGKEAVTRIRVRTRLQLAARRALTGATSRRVERLAAADADATNMRPRAPGEPVRRAARGGNAAFGRSGKCHAFAAKNGEERRGAERARRDSNP
jgi:hypothetical protein